MATIYYEILGGEAPFTAELRENTPPYSTIATSTGIGIGEHYFTNIPDGDYIVIITDVLGCLIYFYADVSCVTTTTTLICNVYGEIVDNPTTTTTTTDFYIIACNGEFNSAGREAYPLNSPTATVILGNELGDVEYLFTPINIPDRFMLKFDGNWVIDTGYVYNYYSWTPDRYNYGGIYRYRVEEGLNGKVDPLSGLTYPILGADLANYTASGYNMNPNEIAEDGYPVIGYVIGYYDWHKSSTTPTADVYVFSPLENTEWKLQIFCPGYVVVTTTTTMEPTTTTTTSSSTTTTTTTLPPTTTTTTTGDINTVFVYYDVLPPGDIENSMFFEDSTDYYMTEEDSDNYLETVEE